MYKLMIQTIIVPENSSAGDKSITKIHTHFIEFDMQAFADKAFSEINRSWLFEYGAAATKTRAIKLY